MIQTYTGKMVDPLNLKLEEICIEDIAHSLSLQCRFMGYCKEFYSVAQHSWLVSQICPIEEAFAGLLHDAAESYLGDMVRPIKKLSNMSFYREAENEVLKKIFVKFGLIDSIESNFELPLGVIVADNRMLATKAEQLMGEGSADRWGLREKPFELMILKPLD